MRKSQQIGRIIVDIICLGLVFLPWLCIQLLASPFHRGFFCDDESIGLPYKDSTITTEVLTVVGLAVPILCFLITEGAKFASHKRRGMADPPYMIGNKALPFLLYQYYKVIGVFLFGAAFQQTVVNIAKYSIGRLRPHFFDVCAPNYSLFNCTDSRNLMVYVDADVCTANTDEKKTLEMRLSFMSGHASFSAYAAVYLAIYFQARFTWKGSKLLCPLLQCFAIMTALYCSFSRVSDHKHHWSDVLIGALFGSIIACICAIHYTDFFHQKKIPSDMKVSSTDLANELEQVKITSINSRPISRITYLTDEVTPSGDYQENNTNHRNYYSIQP